MNYDSRLSISSKTTEKLLKALKAPEASKTFEAFVKFIKPDYQVKWFHSLICQKLDEFEKGKIKKLMILLPPQHGKSELTTRKFPGYLMGKNPDRKIAIATYNDTMSNTFNRAIQRTMDCEEYLMCFPDVMLNESKLHSKRQSDKERNTDNLDILFREGRIKTLGRGGSLTGNPVDIGIIDDPLKDRIEAQSETIRKNMHEWYVDVWRTRLHNDSQELLIQTRWHEDDLGGRLEKNESDWVVIKLPAIRENDINDYDPREPGEALWPEKHSLDKILAIKSSNEVTFNSLYQQTPKPNTKLLVFGHWSECDCLPIDSDKIFWGLDFGFTNDPTALVKCVKVGNKIFLKECCYQPGIPGKRIKELLDLNGYNGEPVYCDHNDPETVAEMRRLQVIARPALKSIEAGISKCNEFEIYFTKDSGNIRTERGKYQYESYGELITNIPVDADNHLMDAARYAIYTHHFRG